MQFYELDDSVGTALRPDQMEELHQQLPEQPVLVVLPELLGDALPREVRQGLGFVVGEVLDSPQEPGLSVLERQNQYAQIDHAEVVIPSQGQPADTQGVRRIQPCQAVGTPRAVLHQRARCSEAEVGESGVGVLQDLHFRLEDQLDPPEELFSHPIIIFTNRNKHSALC